MNVTRIRQARAAVTALAAATLLGGCLVGPDYRRPSSVLPERFKEGADWERASPDAQAAITSTWWQMFGDTTLNELIDRALRANQSIVSAEAAYRLARADTEVARAALYPTLAASASASRSRSAATSATTAGAAAGATAGAGADAATASAARITNSFEAGLDAAWEPDLWGGVRRSIEANADLAQASDAQLAGERISIAALVATDYFALRQADSDLHVMDDEERIEEQIVAMTADAVVHGTASNDQLLNAQNIRDGIVANLENEKAVRATYEHALAVLVGAAPATFSVAALSDYAFVLPAIPASIPSVVLERRPDVVSAERTAAAANARIGVAEAAFYPTLDLTASASLVANTLPRLFSVPARVWSLGPALSETIFDGGARSAEVDVARATYDEQVAQYRLTVLTAFQNVEDSLAQVSHISAQGRALHSVYTRSQQLYSSILAQQRAGTASQQDVLNVQLTLETARQNWQDSESQLAQLTVALVRNLGGGWDGAAGDERGASQRSDMPARTPGSDCREQAIRCWRSGP